MELTSVSTKQRQIAMLAEQMPELAFTSLNHHVDMDWLKASFQRTRKDGAAGVDGQTAAEYAVNLENNLKDLIERAKSGTYVAPPVRRVHIPKGTPGKTRPIGIPTFEDKVLQRAVLMLLEPIYEHDFHDCSYGFRPGRSAHQALDRLWKRIMEMGGCWILDVDISKFFDTLDKGHLRKFIQHRVRDGVISRLINKWLKAGVMEKGQRTNPEKGTPQGGVISPLLSNIYLHEVLDSWVEEEVRPRLSGRMFLIRFADDFVMGFERESDARRVMEVLPRRSAKYGLTFHPDKTRLIDFRRPERGGTNKGNFEFLGFCHYWGTSRRGNKVVKRKTASSRLARTLRDIGEWCRRNLHQPVCDQHRALCRKVLGHYAYFGITGNFRRLMLVRYAVERIWRKWLNRRSRLRSLHWDRFIKLLKNHPLPNPRILHSVMSPRCEAVT